MAGAGMTRKRYTCKDHAPLERLGYLSWVEITAQMDCDGFTNRQCGECNLWAVWVRNDKRRTVVRTLPKFHHYECDKCGLGKL